MYSFKVSKFYHKRKVNTNKEVASLFVDMCCTNTENNQERVYSTAEVKSPTKHNAGQISCCSMKSRTEFHLYLLVKLHFEKYYIDFL